jgi:virginiamycin B lyase
VPFNGLEALTLGPGGDVWASDYNASDEREQIFAVTPLGDVAFASQLGLPETHPGGSVPLVAGGPDDDLWFAWDHSGIVRLVPEGVTRQYAVGAGVTGITVGHEDDLWFADPGADEIGRLSPEGVITRFSYGIAGEPAAITTGAEGDIWFTEPAAHAIGRITPEGAVTQFSEGIGSAPVGIAAGPEGDIWFTEESGEIGRLTP